MKAASLLVALPGAWAATTTPWVPPYPGYLTTEQAEFIDQFAE